MSDHPQLPPGQYELAQLPRFGLQKFARRFPRDVDKVVLEVVGDVARNVTVLEEIHRLPRVEQTADLHCVTTWSHRGLVWSGYRFRDFYQGIVVPWARPAADAEVVVLRGQDGYASSLPLEDLLADDVLLADRLNGKPLSIAHGSPLRLVAPAHYGYKNTKHLCSIEFRGPHRPYRSRVFPFRFMDHPRARVALEERGRGIPGWLLRYLYRPLVQPTIREFQAALKVHLERLREQTRE